MASRRRELLLAALAAAATRLVAAGEAVAQGAETFPSRPVRMVVGFPPGGSSDVSARLVAERMSEEWKQPVIVDNKPGAGGTIAAAFVAAAPADGYTLLHVGPGTHAITSALYKDLSYDAHQELRRRRTDSRYRRSCVVVPASSSVKTIKDLIELARAKPGASLLRLLRQRRRPEHRHRDRRALHRRAVPARAVQGRRPGGRAVLGGQVDFAMADSASAIPHVQSGKLRALAVTTAAAFAALPRRADVARPAVPGFAYPSSVGLARAGRHAARE